MSRTFEEKPPTWTDWANVVDVGHDIFYAIVGEGIKEGDKAHNVWVWHWHTPTNMPARWQLSACGNHTVVQVDPLTLVNSLACEDGCPSHGWITDGRWIPC